MSTLTRAALDHPIRTIVGWLAVVVMSVPLALGLEHELKAGGFNDPGAESVLSQETLERAFDDAPNSLQVVVTAPGGAKAAIDDAVEAATDFPHVERVDSYEDDPAWLSSDGATGLIQVSFSSDDTTTQGLVPDLRNSVTAALPPGAEVDVTGASALEYDLNVQSKQDATRAEMIAFPLLFVVLLLVFRSVGAMVVPLGLAGAALVVTNGIGALAARVVDLQILFTNGVSLIGLAVAVDYSLFIVKRYREELAAGADYRPALETAMRTAGHAVLFSALAVVVALSTLFIPGLLIFTSIGLAGVIVTLVALVMSMTLLPALLVLMGRRIHFGALPGRRSSEAVRGTLGSSGPVPSRLRAGLVVAALGVGFAVMALPMQDIRLQVPVASADILPADMDSRTGVERLEETIGTEGLFPLQVVLSGSGPDAVRTAAGQAQAAIGSVAGVSGVFWDGTVAPDGNSEVARLVVAIQLDPDSVAAHDLVTELRDVVPAAVGPAVTAGVTGATATGTDFDRAVVSSLPAVVGAVVLATMLLLGWAFRSWRLPLLALVLNAAVVAGSLGLLTALSQGLLGEEINSVTPLLLFAIMFGLSMDYLVIMISRMREFYLDGASHDAAITLGLRRTARLVNGAAVIMVAVFVSFVSAEISIVRQLGIGLAVAVVLDAVVVRSLLMPAALRLVGPRIWGRTASAPLPVPVPPAPTAAVVTEGAS